MCLIGIESQPVRRFGFVPADGPEQWSAGTLFPRSSKKVARAINAASGNRPLVVLANLSGFDGSPESMRKLQLEYGAEIGRAIVNFRGPIVFCVISRYHGGAFVVFSKRAERRASRRSPSRAATRPSSAARRPRRWSSRATSTPRTGQDPRVAELEARIAGASGDEKRRPRGAAPRRSGRPCARRSSARWPRSSTASTRCSGPWRWDRWTRSSPAERLRPYLVEAIERGVDRGAARRLKARAGSSPRPAHAGATRAFLVGGRRPGSAWPLVMELFPGRASHPGRRALPRYAWGLMHYRDDRHALEARRDDLRQELAALGEKADQLRAAVRDQEAAARELAALEARLAHLEARRASLLENVRIASPCSASWDDMVGDERVRFCGQCTKNVYNPRRCRVTRPSACSPSARDPSACASTVAPTAPCSPPTAPWASAEAGAPHDLRRARRRRDGGGERVPRVHVHHG